MMSRNIGEGFIAPDTAAAATLFCFTNYFYHKQLIFVWVYLVKFQSCKSSPQLC